MARIGEFRWALLSLTMLCVCDSARAGDEDNPEAGRIPVVGRPTADFYGAAGTRVTIKAKADPTDLRTDEWLTLTLTVDNLLNAPAVEKPSLKKLREFAPFQIEESPELDPKSDLGKRDHRVFVYKLRPSSEKLTIVPEIAFHYFDPTRRVAPDRPGDRFPKAFSNAIVILVRSASAKPQATVATPIDVPQFAESIAADDKVLSIAPTRRPGWMWLLVLIVPPLLAVGWVIAWRAIYPDAVKLRQLRRNKAVRHALAALDSVSRRPSDDSAGRIAIAVNGYLHKRFDLATFARTLSEIAAHLQSMNLAPERVEQVANFFRSCDAARFSPAHVTVPELADDAKRLIIALEEPA